MNINNNPLYTKEELESLMDKTLALIKENERLINCLLDISLYSSTLISSKGIGEKRDGCIEAKKMVDRTIKRHGCVDILDKYLAEIPGGRK